MKPVPYSRTFAKRFPETVEKQLRKDGAFDENEIRLLNPTEIAYLIGDGSNGERGNEILGFDLRNRRNVCSALWLTHPAIATKASCPSESVSLNFSLTIEPTLASDPRYESRLRLALNLLKDNPLQTHNIFAKGPWRVVPKDQSVNIVLIPSLGALQNLGMDISGLPPETMGLTRYSPHPLTGEVTITVYLTGASIRSGVYSLSMILAHELFGHVYDALNGVTKQKTDVDNEKSASQRAIGYADVLKQWVRQHIRGVSDVSGMLGEIDEAKNLQKIFMESLPARTGPSK